MRSGACHRGFSLVELLLALALGGIVLTALAAVSTASVRWMGAVWGRSEALEAVRTAWVLLDEELRPGRPGRDWRVAAAGDRIDLRAFRGLATVCGPGPGPGVWVVAPRTRRAAEPGRDSLLVLHADGGWRPAALEAASAGGDCGPDPSEPAELWRWTAAGTGRPVLVRLFESGALYLADGALRYRRGGGGRQPLTAERIGPASRFEPADDGVRIRIVTTGPMPGESPRSFDWLVSGEGNAPPDPGPVPSGPAERP